VTIAGSTSKVVKFTGIQNMGRTITILMRGSNRMVLDEADRSLHDALCVVRSLVKKRFLIAGGGSPEAEMSLRLSQWAKTLTGVKSYCVRAFAEVK
jgi:T-complex protein 1 subunit delta